MAGSRVHKYKSIIKRVQGLLKSEALAWKDRPLWYDVMERFPPKVDPDFERPIPTEPVRKILYPEDVIRAKFYEEFQDREINNMRVQREGTKTRSQVFVEKYIELRQPGMTPDKIFEKVEENLTSDGYKLVRKSAKNFVAPKPDVDDVEVELEKPMKLPEIQIRQRRI